MEEENGTLYNSCIFTGTILNNPQQKVVIGFALQEKKFYLSINVSKQNEPPTMIPLQFCDNIYDMYLNRLGTGMRIFVKSRFVPSECVFNVYYARILKNNAILYKKNENKPSVIS